MPGCKATLIPRQTIVQGSPTIFEENVSTIARAWGPTMRSMFPPLVGLKKFSDMKNLSGLI